MPGMTNPNTELSIFVQEDGSGPTGFFEIRRNGSSLWFTQGVPYTFGYQELHELATDQAASDFESGLIAERQAQGFRLLHRGSYKPGELDFELFESVIRDGVRRAYRRICADRAGERISGFALFTDGCGMTIGTAAMGTSWSKADIVDANQYRTNFTEWPYSTDDGLLLAYRLLMASYLWMEIPFEREVPDYRERFFETCVRALERLDKEGLFGTGSERDEFILLFGESDGGHTRSFFERLNPPRVRERYIDHFPY